MRSRRRLGKPVSPKMPKPDHLMALSDGSLHDTRLPFASGLVRKCYSRHFRAITNTHQLRASLRAGRSVDGGYPIYFITDDGGTLSYDAVRGNLREVLWCVHHRDNTGGWRVICFDVNYEDDLVCDHTGEAIEKAYA